MEGNCDVFSRVLFCLRMRVNVQSDMISLRMCFTTNVLLDLCAVRCLLMSLLIKVEPEHVTVQTKDEDESEETESRSVSDECLMI